MLLPAEIESRWLIPATRSIIARELSIKYDFSQEDIASVLGITQAAVSYYISGNRGCDSTIRKLRSNQNVMRFVNDIVKELNRNHSFTPYCMSKYIEMFNYIKHSLFICKIHRSVEDGIDEALCRTCEGHLLSKSC